MADHAATAPTEAGASITERTGAASGDTVPGGSLILARNTGAGTHVMTFAVSATFRGLAVTSRAVSMAAGTNATIRVPREIADANNLVAVTIDGAATEVKYFVVGA